MLAKKNQKYDFSKNSTLFFTLGLLCMTVFSYFVIELELEKINLSYDPKIEKEIDLVEDPIVYVPQEQKIKPVRLQPFVNDFVEVKNNTITEPVDITPIANFPTPKSDAPTSSMPTDNIPVYIEPVVEPEKVDFILVEDTPIFPGCENLSKAERDACFREKVLNHIKRNLRYPENALENDQKGKVFVQFIIEKDGTISIANIRGVYESLNKEAQRVIKSLPKIKPGEQRNKPVKVSYSIPIVFQN